MKNKSEFTKGQKVNFYGHEAIIIKVSQSENLNGWFTYSVKYYNSNGDRQGMTEVEEHELKHFNKNQSNK